MALWEIFVLFRQPCTLNVKPWPADKSLALESKGRGNLTPFRGNEKLPSSTPKVLSIKFICLFFQYKGKWGVALKGISWLDMKYCFILLFSNKFRAAGLLSQMFSECSVSVILYIKSALAGSGQAPFCFSFYKLLI